MVRAHAGARTSGLCSTSTFVHDDDAEHRVGSRLHRQKGKGVRRPDISVKACTALTGSATHMRRNAAPIASPAPGSTGRHTIRTISEGHRLRALTGHQNR